MSLSTAPICDDSLNKCGDVAAELPSVELEPTESASPAHVDSIITVSHASSITSKATFRRYLVAMLAGMLFMVASIGCFNYWVDPYLRFGSPRIEGFNAIKPAAIKQVKMAKAYQVCRGQYRTILLGNSRVDVGIDPESAAFPSEYRPVYNLGQPGTGSEAALRYLEHALVHCRPTNVIIGVDFMSFLEDTDEGSPLATSARVPAEHLRLSSIQEARGSFARTRQNVQDLLAADLSLSALADSIRTVAAQGNPLSADLTEQGFNTAQAFRALIRTEGQAALFEQKNAEYEAKLLRQHAPSFQNSSEIKALLGIIRLCRNQKIALKLFVHPYHADVLRIIERTGHWNEFEAWKLDLASTCDREGVELWDFSAYSAVTTEPVPSPGDRKTVMKGYWESGHYRAAIGDLMLAQMFGQPRLADFGSRLSQREKTSLTDRQLRPASSLR